MANPAKGIITPVPPLIPQEYPQDENSLSIATGA